MSWTQVYVTGLSQTIEPSDEELERILEARYNLSPEAAVDNNNNNNNNNKTNDNEDVGWAGSGSTLVKRDKSTGACRGYAFLAFFSSRGAEIVVDRINNNYTINATANNQQGLSLPLPMLRAELSKPKEKPSKKKSSSNNGDRGEDHSDIRLRRKRGAPVRKHPVIVSSNKVKTGLGNKTK